MCFFQSTSNYLARRYGVRAAMPGFIAKKLCPDLIIVPASFDKYREVSQQVRNILTQYDPNMCPMSLDEAYLDITQHLEWREHSKDGERTFPKRVSEDDQEIMCQCGKDQGQLSEVTGQGRSHGQAGQGQSEVKGEQKADYSSVCKECGRAKRGEIEYETFGLGVEEAVREMRFRIEQRTKLTASAGNSL